MLEFDVSIASVLGLVVTVLLPLGVGLVTNKVTDSSVKAILLAALASVTAVVTSLAEAVAAETTFNIGQALVYAIFGFIAAVGMHFGLYKPVGASARLQEVGYLKDSA